MAGELAGHPIPIGASELIHGKTGPPPRGAVLFGPFSYAHKKKDEGKGDVMGVVGENFYEKLWCRG